MMRSHLLGAVGLAAGLAGALVAQTPSGIQFAALPDNPCDLLTREQVAAATGLVVTSRRRKPDLMQIVAAQKTHRNPDPGTICSYETQSEFGQLKVVVPTPAERTAARYREARDHYLATYPGSARMVSGVGEEAWLAGGGDLWVLTRQGEFSTNAPHDARSCCR